MFAVVLFLGVCWVFLGLFVVVVSSDDLGMDLFLSRPPPTGSSEKEQHIENLVLSVPSSSRI